MGLQCLALLLADEDIGQAPKNTEIGHIRLAPIALPACVGDVAIESRGGHAIASVCKRRHSMAPERRRELGLSQEGSGTLRCRPVRSLCDSILVGLVRLSVLPVDAMLSAKVDVLLSHVLPTLVVACGLDAKAQAVLSICLVRLEGLKSVALALEVGHGPETRGIIDEYHPVKVALRCWSGELALEVSVDQGKANELPGGKTRDGVAIELASKAGLTEGVGRTLGAKSEAMDKLLSHYRAQIIEIDMPTVLVPQGEVLVAGGGCRERGL